MHLQNTIKEKRSSSEEMSSVFCTLRCKGGSVHSCHCYNEIAHEKPFDSATFAIFCNFSSRSGNRTKVGNDELKIVPLHFHRDKVHGSYRYIAKLFLKLPPSSTTKERVELWYYILFRISLNGSPTLQHYPHTSTFSIDLSSFTRHQQ